MKIIYYFIVCIGVLTSSSAVTPSPELEEKLLIELGSNDVIQVEKTLRLIRNEELISPNILHVLYKLLDDTRPDERRLSKDVLEKSPSKNSYDTLSRITGFKPSQPSLLFKESIAELKPYLHAKYPEIFSSEEQKQQVVSPETKSHAVVPETAAVGEDSNQVANLPSKIEVTDPFVQPPKIKTNRPNSKRTSPTPTRDTISFILLAVLSITIVIASRKLWLLFRKNK